MAPHFLISSKGYASCIDPVPSDTTRSESQLASLMKARASPVGLFANTPPSTSEYVRRGVGTWCGGKYVGAADVASAASTIDTSPHTASPYSSSASSLDLDTKKTGMRCSVS